ncbi:MAG: cytochrome ubiquinol oxidase subunit I, partial [Actinomycetota bacterium]|nr:cytochrome ubiquinol oxidase subunit I [Actinomycetota bacterium]
MEGERERHLRSSPRNRVHLHHGEEEVNELLVPALDVDPVPWARAQMAFTLGFHIILVPLGVSWAAMTLIANYRG